MFTLTQSMVDAREVLNRAWITKNTWFNALKSSHPCHCGRWTLQIPSSSCSPALGHARAPTQAVLPSTCPKEGSSQALFLFYGAGLRAPAQDPCPGALPFPRGGGGSAGGQLTRISPYPTADPPMQPHASSGVGYNHPLPPRQS